MSIEIYNMKSIGRPVIWKCLKFGEEYAAKISDRIKSDEGCPYCAGRKVLPGSNDLMTEEQ